MNNKQIIILWCGIAAIVLAGFNVIQNNGLMCPYGFSVWALMVALITGGLFCTFKDNGRKETEKEKQREIEKAIEKEREKEKEKEREREREKEREIEKEKEKNKIQDIRGNILKRKQFKLKRDSQDNDK